MANELRRLQTCRLDKPANRRGHSLLDESRQRAREHHPKAYGIDRPAHDVERARPGVLGRRLQLAATPRAASPAKRPPPHHRRKGPKKSRLLLFRDRDAGVSVQSSITTTSTTSPGSARASRAPSAKPETPPAQPRPNTGTRITPAAIPAPDQHVLQSREWRYRSRRLSRRRRHHALEFRRDRVRSSPFERRAHSHFQRRLPCVRPDCAACSTIQATARNSAARCPRSTKTSASFG